ENVVADDHGKPGRDDPHAVASRQPRETARTPEDVGESRGCYRISEKGDVPGSDPVVEQLLDDRERSRPDDDYRSENEMCPGHNRTNAERGGIVRSNAARI